MSLAGKLERDVEMKSSAYNFHAVFSGKPQLLKTMIPDTVQSCDLQHGQLGTPGAILYWNYTEDGEAKVAKEVIEEIDDENFWMKMNVIEGDVLKDYKVFKITVKATPKGKGCVVRWTLEYERQSPQTPHPHKLLDLAAQGTVGIDDSLVTQLQSN